MLTNRIRGVVLGATAALAIAGQTACSPTGQNTFPEFHAQGTVLDINNNRIVRLNNDYDLIVDSAGNVLKNVGTGSAQSIGWASIFSGATVEGIPRNPAPGPLGPRRILFWGMDNRYSAVDFHMQASFALYGWGFHASEGDCTIVGRFAIRPGGARPSNVWQYGTDTSCTKLRYQTARMSSADRAHFNRMPASAQRRVQAFYTWASHITFKGSKP